MGAGHDHGAGAPLLASRVGRLLGGVALAVVVLTLVGLAVLWPRDAPDDLLAQDGAFAVQLVDGTVTSIEQGPCPGTDEAAGIDCELVEVEVTSGPTAGDTAVLQSVPGSTSGELGEGDAIVLGYTPDADEGFQYYFADRQRRGPLLWLGLLFAVAVVALGRWQGVRALVALGLSLAVIVAFVLPAILAGSSPVWVAVVGALVVAAVAIFFTHGVDQRSTVAFLGTAVSLLLTGLLAAVFVGTTQLTGLASEESTLLTVSAGQIDLRGLLLAGIVIGSLGVLDDVTVTQVAAVDELRRADPAAGPGRLWRGALRIGRDHIGATVNTLVLAYAGAALPLLLLFTQTDQGLVDVLNGEVVAVEVVRTLVGSIGLVASVPITTGLAVLAMRALADEGDDDGDDAGEADQVEVPVPDLGAAAPPTGAPHPEEHPEDPYPEHPPTEPPASPPPPEPVVPPEPPPPPPSWDDFSPTEDDLPE